MRSASSLRSALLANAVFSFFSGTALILQGLGFSPWLSISLGLQLLSFAGFVLYARRKATEQAGWSVLVWALDWAWVLAALALSGLAELPAGLGSALAWSALPVGALALWEWHGLKMLAFDGPSGLMQALRPVTVTPVQAWAVLSDLKNFSSVAGTLSHAQVVEGSGKGAVRECQDHQGRCWRETCDVWDEGRRYGFEVHTQVPGYPFPFKAVRGDWGVDANGMTCVIWMKMEIEPKGGAWAQWVAAPLLLGPGTVLLQGILRRWAKLMRP